MNSTFNVIARYRTKSGSTDFVLENLKELAEQSRNEPGNISYEFFRGVEDDRRIVILESYNTADDFEFHRQSPHFSSIGAGRIIPELESRTIETYIATNQTA